MSNERKETNINGWRLFLSLLLFIWIMACTLITLRYLFLAWSGDYSFLRFLLQPTGEFVVSDEIRLATFTVAGALLGGATLSITSLHKYSAVTKTLDVDHLWGYLMAPVLSVVIGLLIFCLLYSGLMVLNGGTSINSELSSVRIGYLSLGAICSYNWDVFVLKLQKLSKHVTSE
ncbi:hypothetical protein VQ412_001571 [Escherichia coli]|uniref:hypothetical protein n=1 Tax=Escherichia coli TaxID=562 RepID=UPI0003EE1B65|nr:hypothetical protein [Escherichia coli]EEZ7035782.1 hypothetical protein [Escherichia coli O175]EEZ9679367.1 hypothetical protein [Escherichia coli O55]EFE1032666.1 hypothetical protein [Escherichia coli O8:H8]EKF6380461.1 hypothetical protein [Escherichia coli O8]EAB0395501.1 hypothetical protein [Escherichia coli]